MTTRFQDLLQCTGEDVAAALRRNDPDELALMSITMAMISSDNQAVQKVCVCLCTHHSTRVRGNAVTGLGHLARRFRELDECIIKPLVEAALADQDEYVRTHARSAADEIHQFLGWSISGHVYGADAEERASR